MISRSLFIVLFYSLTQTSINTQNKTDNLPQMTSKLIQPPYLKIGDTVAIIAPSGILKNREHKIQQAIHLLKSWQLNVIVGKYIFSKANHFAGTDNERYKDLQNAMDKLTISAIWCARGGYGTVRILDKLDYTRFKQNPKWIIGYSDITALHNQVHNQGFQSLHALMCTCLTKDTNEIKATVKSFKYALFGKPENYTLRGSAYNKTGETKGQLVGGNLTILHSMLGSKTSINTSNKILFIEEIGEYKYHIDRMLQSLKRADYFNHCKGLIVGNMSKLRKNATLWGTTIEQLILNVVKDYSFPVAFNMPAGHKKDNRTLVLGATVQLFVNKEQSTIIYEK